MRQKNSGKYIGVVLKMGSKPYISFVVVGRNDNYGHKFLERFQIFIDNLVFLCEKHNLDAELIVLEWNPPLKEKRLFEVLETPKSSKVSYRFIEIPKKIHDNFKNEKNAPLLEYPGKNVGIRKAEGEFVLITNPDIIISNEMIEFLSKKKLKKRVIYRTSRFDLPIDVPSELKGEDLLKFCEKNWRVRWDIRFGRSPRGLKRILYIPRMFARFVYPFIFEKYLPYRYHGGMPGDFTLLSKEDWETIGGYPEMGWTTVLDFYAIIFSIITFGKMKKLPYKIYHQHHERNVPRDSDFQKYIEDSIKMLKTKKIIGKNLAGWGLEGVKLKETKFKKR